MLEYLKKIYKLILCSALWIHLIACSTNRAIMKIDNGCDQCGESDYHITGNEFDHIKQKLSKECFIEYIVKGLLNVLPMVKHHHGFQAPISIEDLKEYGLLTPDGESLSISNQNKEKALELCTDFYGTTPNDINANLNNPVSLTTFFIYKSCRLFDRLSNRKNCSSQSFEKLSFAQWRSAYTRAVHALKATSQP